MADGRRPTTGRTAGRCRATFSSTAQRRTNATSAPWTAYSLSRLSPRSTTAIRTGSHAPGSRASAPRCARRPRPSARPCSTTTSSGSTCRPEPIPETSSSSRTTSLPRAVGSASATLFPLVQPGLHVADADSAASDRVDDLRWRLGAARVPRAATSLGVEPEQTTAERRTATVMRVGDPARGRRDRHRSPR